MEFADVDLIYAFVVAWTETSRGVFFSDYFPTLETCMSFLNQWEYNPNQITLSCIQILPE